MLLQSPGPVECRRGTLLLTESAVELLGGEVQEIAVSNSLSGLLSTKLGVTITSGTQSKYRLLLCICYFVLKLPHWSEILEEY